MKEDLCSLFRPALLPCYFVQDATTSAILINSLFCCTYTSDIPIRNKTASHRRANSCNGTTRLKNKIKKARNVAEKWERNYRLLHP